VVLPQDQEIEVKFCIADLQRLTRKLEEAGGKLTIPRTHEFNIRYDTSRLELTHDYRLLRLRKDNEVHMTYKGPAEITGGVSKRTEVEFEANDFEAADRFIKALGYKTVVTYEKYRTTYDLDGMKVTLDEMPYGDFVEIEGHNPEVIQDCAAKLGLKIEAALAESYLRLFDRAKKVLRLSFRDLTFENFEGIDIELDHLGVVPADV
jgi:adenylate cyclase class 2